MKQFQVLTDSTADVEKKFRDKYDLDYIKMIFTIDGKDYDADLDWSNIAPNEYYEMMRSGKRSVTGQIQPAEVEEKFKKYLDEGLDILYVSCSSRLSGSYNYAEVYAKELLEKYPGRRIVCFDSLRSNYAEGLIAMDAAKYALEGKSLDETVSQLTKDRLSYQVYATSGSLAWLKKAGRVKASSAFFGNLIGIKPIIVSDAKGNNFAFKKVKGRKASLDEFVSIACERMTDPKNSLLCIEHADCYEDAKYIATEISKIMEVKEINISDLGPIIGATTGPDTVTISFIGKKVTIADGQ